MALLDSVLPKPASTHHNAHHDKRRSFGSGKLSDSTTPTIPSPSPSHTREKSLDDLVLENVPVFDYYGNNSTIPRAPGVLLARSPTSSPTQRRTATTSGHKSQLSITQLHQSNEQLQKALEFEENETMRLEKLLKDIRHKADSSQFEQKRLEQDVVQRDEQIALLQKQLKDTKRSKHELENTLTEEQMTYINEKAAWLDKENEYEAKLSKLRATSHHHEEPTRDNASIYSAASANSSTVNIKEGPPRAPPPPSLEHTKMIDRLKNEVELTRQQLELVSKEYALRHEQVKQELEQVKQVNSRLQEESEGFQVLLAQKTVLGEFSLADELDRFGFEEDDQDGDDGEGSDTDDDVINGSKAEMNTNEEMKRMKSRMYDLEFENKSLQNHNRALKISLERLVQRLLEFREFESVVEDSNQDVTQRSISLFHRRVSSSHPNQSSQRHGSILDIPRRRPQPTSLQRDNLEPPHYNNNGQTILAGSASSIASGGGSPRSATSSVFQFPRAHNRVVKPASTWSSMIFVNNRTSQNALPDNGLDSPLSTTSSSNTTYGDVASSGASSIINLADDSDIKSVLNNSEPRRPPVTHGQKKLRPLRLQSTSFEAAEAPLQSATSSSSWSFGMY